jgi:hypothetical protein
MASTILSDNGVSSGSAGLKSSADSTGVLALQTSTSGGAATTALTIDTSQRVGVGTTSPSYVLDVQKTASAQFRLFSTNNSTGSQLILGSGTGTGTTSQYVYFDNSLTFSAAGVADRMIIDSSGNVGIGTSSPAAKFNTSGSSAAGYIGNYFDNTASNGYVRLDLRIGSSGANGIASIKYAPGIFMQIGPDLNDTTTPLVFATNNATERMRISSAGYVTMPYQPAFYAYPSGEIPASASTVLAFNATTFNVGSCYNTSTYRFTAPLAGRYVFEQQSLAQGSSSMLDVSVRVNGTAQSNFRTYSADAQVGGGVVLSLAANDYVDFYRSYTDRNTYPGPIWSFFSGYFLG